MRIETNSDAHSEPGFLLQEGVPLAPLTTFGIGGPARFFAEVHDEDTVLAAVRLAAYRGLSIFVLGGGSNLLVSDEGHAGLVLKIGISGIEHCGEGCFDVGAGEMWDRFVDATVAADCAGIECLAGIPGSVGGTPVQNVGAYGQEVGTTIASVRALDRESLTFVELSHAQCRFRYRGSLFNADEPDRYVVTRVRFQLTPRGIPQLTYADLQRRFANTATTPTLADVAQAVRSIRHSKGMLLVEGDPDCRSAGSFFKNPVVAADRLPALAAAAGLPPDSVPHWPTPGGDLKLPAAWLLEQAGFTKGYGAGPARVSSRHTLALTNRGDARYADVARLAQEIIDGVQHKFGIRLEREPVLLG